MWIRVRLAGLGQPRKGWVRRFALGGYGTVATHLVVNVHSLRTTLFRNGRAIFRAAVGIGKAAWPTPCGEFYIRNRLTDFASPMYGPVGVRDERPIVRAYRLAGRGLRRHPWN